MTKNTFRKLGLFLLFTSAFLSSADAKNSARPFRYPADEDEFGIPHRAYAFYAARLHLSDGRLFSLTAISAYPNDPYYGSSGSWGQSYADLWGVKRINAEGVWGLYRGSGITIAVVDTGLIFGHEDISSGVWKNLAELNGLPGVDDDGNGFVDDVKGWDFVANDNDPYDLNGHGTHVAGIAAAAGNNGKGIIGVAPLAKVMAVRVLNKLGYGTIQNVANGIRYAARMGARIINLSLGGSFLDPTSYSILQNAVTFAKNLGSIVVAAAGNSNSNVDNFSPANMDGAIAVGAIDPFDSRASFSNFGSKLWIMAPGVDILSLGVKKTHIGTRLTDKYYRASGTSMAAPFVSGAVALLLNKYPLATFEEIRELLAAGAEDLGDPGWDPYYGYGLLDTAGSLGVVIDGSAESSGAEASTAGTSSGTQSAALAEILEKQALEESLNDQREEIKEAGASLVAACTYDEPEFPDEQ